MNFRRKKLLYNLMTLPAIAYNSRRCVVSKVCLKLGSLLYSPLLAYRNLILLCSLFILILWTFSPTVLHKFLPDETDKNTYSNHNLNPRFAKVFRTDDSTDPTLDLRAYRDRKLSERRAIPIIFVGGMPRSGTTLMRAILDAHPEVRCGEETRVIPRLLFMRKNWSASKVEAKRLTEARITENVLDSAIGEFILAILTERNIEEPLPDTTHNARDRHGEVDDIQRGDGNGQDEAIDYKDDLPNPRMGDNHFQNGGDDDSDGDSVIQDDFNPHYDPQRLSRQQQKQRDIQQYEALQNDVLQPHRAQVRTPKSANTTVFKTSKFKPVRLCNKDPFVMKTADVVGRIFPRAKFVFMIRDGRAVVQSVVSRKVTITGWNVQDHKQSLAMWNQGIEQMYDICRDLGPSRCLPVHYETLVLKPMSTISKILNFLDLPWNDLVMRHSEMVGKPDGISLSKLERSSDQVIKPINTQALYNWVQGFPAELFSKAFEIAPMLETLNYSSDGVPYYGEPDPLVKQNDKMIQDNRDFYEEKQKYFQRLPGT